MSDAYKIFRQIQEKDKKAKQYTNYEKEDLIDEILELQEREEQLQNNWNELKESLEKDIKEYEESEFHIKKPPLTIQTKIDLLLKMQELENRKV